MSAGSSRGCARSGAAGWRCSLAVAFTPLANALHARLAARPRSGRADAIVVLGAGVSTTGTLSDSSLRRAVTASSCSGARSRPRW